MHILVSTDFSAASINAFAHAKKQASLDPATRFTLMAVFEDLVPTAVQFEFGLAFVDAAGLEKQAYEKAEKRLAEFAAKYFQGAQLVTKLVRAKQSVAQELVDFAQTGKVDMIVMATHGRSGFRHMMLGSVAEKVIRLSPCPVLVIPVRGEK